MFTEHDYDFIVLGTPMYQGYYTTHDMDASTIAFTPLRGLIKDPLMEKNGIPPYYLLPRPDEEDNCRFLCFERKVASTLLFGVPKFILRLVRFILETLFELSKIVVQIPEFIIKTLVMVVKILLTMVKWVFLAIYYFFYFFYWIFVVK